MGHFPLSLLLLLLLYCCCKIFKLTLLIRRNSISGGQTGPVLCTRCIICSTIYLIDNVGGGGSVIESVSPEVSWVPNDEAAGVWPLSPSVSVVFWNAGEKSWSSKNLGRTSPKNSEYWTMCEITTREVKTVFGRGIDNCVKEPVWSQSLRSRRSSPLGECCSVGATSETFFQ